MREILGRRRMTRSTLRNAALTCATHRRWPVLPGASVRSGDGSPHLSCSCADPECVVPGAHPLDPVLLAATTDARMVRWWWTRRPDASLLLATGTAVDGRRAPCALSVPATAGASALARFDRLGVRLGPVVATPTRYALLVEPYELAELGEILYAQDRVPSSLRFHGDGGYVVLPPSPVVTGGVRWERPPQDDAEQGTPWLPRMEDLLETLIEASVDAPDSGSRLAY
ncbi:bifunctional DNA primase/polymerase [Streptomyces sp. TR06-5]|uniref:bifunctional DNA primase/polymerase n=1 Tax=unclassified Streptomyces TaxID=2593676 RepID=UPI00399F725A